MTAAPRTPLAGGLPPSEPCPECGRRLIERDGRCYCVACSYGWPWHRADEQTDERGEEGAA